MKIHLLSRVAITSMSALTVSVNAHAQTGQHLDLKESPCFRIFEIELDSGKDLLPSKLSDSLNITSDGEQDPPQFRCITTKVDGITTKVDVITNQISVQNKYIKEAAQYLKSQAQGSLADGEQWLKDFYEQRTQMYPSEAARYKKELDSLLKQYREEQKAKQKKR